MVKFKPRRGDILEQWVKPIAILIINFSPEGMTANLPIKYYFYKTFIKHIMGQSLVKNYIHIVFSTKHRQDLILPEFEDDLYDYLGGICRSLSCPSLIVGGYLNHIHILCRLSQKISLVQFVQKLKSNSSKWVKDKSPLFYWQDGYGAFSVSQSQVDTLIKYIKNQRQHHEQKSFKEEYIGLLKKYNVDYNEEYLWS